MGGKSPPSVQAPSNPYADAMAKIVQKFYQQTDPLRSNLINQLTGFQKGGYNPEELPGYAPLYATARSGIEDQYNVAKQQVIGSTPRGGALSGALSDLSSARAHDVGYLPAQISGGLINNLMNQAYGTSMAGVGQATSGLGNAANTWQSGYGQNLNAAMMQQAQNNSMMGLIGGGIGKLLTTDLEGTALGGIGSAIGCCFIFHAVQGEVLHPVVRAYRDTHCTKLNMRGYYRLAEWIVPKMARSKLWYRFVKRFMVDPMTEYGKHFYGFKSRFGALYAPLAAAWLLLYSFLGLKGPVKRSNGEVI